MREARSTPAARTQNSAFVFALLTAAGCGLLAPLDPLPPRPEEDAGGAAGAGEPSSNGGAGRGDAAGGATAESGGSGGQNPAAGGEAMAEAGAGPCSLDALEFPASDLLDDFNRSSIGSNWSSNPGRYAIEADHLTCAAHAEGTWQMVWHETFAPSQEVYATCVDETKSMEFVVKFGTSVICDFISIEYHALTSEIGFGYCVTVGEGVQWGSIGTNVTRRLRPGDVFGGRLLETGELRAYVNGVRVHEADATKVSEVSRFVGRLGKVGVFGDGLAAGVEALAWEDFGGGSVVCP